MTAPAGTWQMPDMTASQATGCDERDIVLLLQEAGRRRGPVPVSRKGHL